VSITQTPATDAAVAAYITERGITEILHFTTDKGAVGIFATGAVLSRDLLDADKYIEHIYTPNCASRLKDADWTGYVNLSISRVNNGMLASSQRWKQTQDIWWVVLAFDPLLLTDQDVHFVTTNNTYPSLRRGQGVEGLRALFADSVEWGYYGTVARRDRDMPDSWTTDVQAEVLYPGRVPITLLRAVYVRKEEHADLVRGMLACFPAVPDVPVAHKPEIFQ
jgi:hypothetical protein